MRELTRTDQTMTRIELLTEVLGRLEDRHANGPNDSGECRSNTISAR